MRAFVATLLFLWTANSPGFAAGQPPDDGVPTPAAVAHLERRGEEARMLDELNAVRAGLHLPPLAFDQQLGRIAQEHAVDMIVRGYFAHETPEGASPFDRMTRAGYRFGWAGENLAINRDAASACRALLASPPHRDNILNPHYRRIGIAAIPDEDGEVFVQDFSD